MSSTTASAPDAGAAAPSPTRLAALVLRRGVLELGPALVFFAVFYWRGIMAGTLAFVAAVAAAAVATGVLRRRLPTMPLVSTVLVACFGIMTVTFDSPAYIKMQTSVSNGFYALAIALGRVSGADLLQRALGDQLQLTGQGWRLLTWRVVGYLAFLAVANEVVRRTMPTETWLTVKVIVVGVVDTLFAGSQIIALRRHWQPTPPDR